MSSMSSSSKENLQRAIFLSKHRRSLKNLYESGNFFTTTETFGDRKLTRKHSEMSSMQINKVNFHKTVSNCDWLRPESKHASRNIPTRPQTSKGSRKQVPYQSVNMLQSMVIKRQLQPSTLHKSSTSAITKKLFKQRQSNANKQLPERNETESSSNAQINRTLVPFNNWEKYDSRRQQQAKQSREEEDQEDEICQDVEVVVNRRAVKCSARQKVSQPQQVSTPIKKGPSMYKNKFQTDLDDEFLQLFAD